MKTLFVNFLLLSSVIYGQSSDYWTNNWKEILIRDYYYADHGGNSSFNDYRISRDKYELIYLQHNDSIIKKVNLSLIDSLFIEINNQKKSKSNPLKMFNRKANWLADNAELLWNEYWRSLDEEKNKEIDSLAISTFKDKTITRDVILSLHGQYSYKNIPFVLFDVRTNRDTLKIGSTGQYPYMLPWHVDKKDIFNSKIASIISKILPNNLGINKDRLEGKDFNFIVCQSIYKQFLEDKIKYLKLKNRYKKEFNYLEKEFKIIKADVSYMSSIEWEGIFKKSLELILLDKKKSSNTQFSTVFNARYLFNSPKSIVRNKRRLLTSLKDNPVYDYTLDCKDCLGEIHWVKTKSLSKEAKKNFLEDIIAKGFNKSKYKGRLKQAIFFELTEERKQETSFSRWIFLKDGTLILWQIEGGFLMNMPKELIQEKGYVCLEMKRENFNVK